MAHTQNSTSGLSRQPTWHTWTLLSLLTLALMGRPVESEAGWVACPPTLPSVVTADSRRRKRRSLCSVRDRLRSVWRYGLESWRQPMLRSLLLATLWAVGGRRGSIWIIGWPWAVWIGESPSRTEGPSGTGSAESDVPS